MTLKLSISKALRYLKSNQWDMGNGQCRDCGGLKPGGGWAADTVGHLPNCPRAIAIESLGGKAVWERPNKSKSTGKCP